MLTCDIFKRPMVKFVVTTSLAITLPFPAHSGTKMDNKWFDLQSKNAPFKKLQKFCIKRITRNEKEQSRPNTDKSKLRERHSKWTERLKSLTPTDSRSEAPDGKIAINMLSARPQRKEAEQLSAGLSSLGAAVSQTSEFTDTAASAAAQPQTKKACKDKCRKKCMRCFYRNGSRLLTPCEQFWRFIEHLRKCKF